MLMVRLFRCPHIVICGVNFLRSYGCGNHSYFSKLSALDTVCPLSNVRRSASLPKNGGTKPGLHRLPGFNRTCKVRVDPTADSGGLSCSTTMNRECERLRRAALHHPRHSECRILRVSRGLSNPCGFQDVASSLQVFGTNDSFLGPVSHKLLTQHDSQSDAPEKRNHVSKSGQVTDLPATCATCSYLQLRNATPAHFWSRPKKRCFAAGALVPCIRGRVLALFCDALFSFVFIVPLRRWRGGTLSQ